MKRLIAGMLVVGLVVVLIATPKPAYAGGHGRFWGGFAAGAVTGLVVGGVFTPRVYAAPAYVYQPAPVYMAPAPAYVYQYQYQPAYVPAPVCSDYWVDQYWNGYGWTPGHWERACR